MTADAAAISAAVAAVVVGIAEGWRRVAATAEHRTIRLGQNLGPRLQEVCERVARLEGKLGMAPPAPSEPAKMEAATDGRER